MKQDIDDIRHSSIAGKEKHGLCYAGLSSGTKNIGCEIRDRVIGCGVVDLVVGACDIQAGENRLYDLDEEGVCFMDA